MNCQKCNDDLQEGVKFCDKCGTSTKIMSDSTKEKFWTVSTESVFGIRWIKTPKAKIITGIVMICLGLVAFLDPDLSGVGALFMLLMVGGAWYIYKGFKSSKNVSVKPQTPKKV